MAEERFRDLGQGRRKSPRRNFHCSAKVIGPDAIHWDGFIVDISGSGARLEFFDTRDIPDEFSLLIGGQSSVKRLCHVIWRSHDRLGVKFVRDPKRLPPAPNGSFWSGKSQKPV